MTLTTSQLPSGSETWTQIDDGTLGNGSIHKRVWKNANQSQGIEIDLIVEPSSAAATSDWARWDSTIKGKVQSAQTATCPGQLGSSCTELIGTTSDGKHQGTIDWQKGAALIVVFYVNANSSVDQSYLEQIATAQDTNIPTS